MKQLKFECPECGTEFTLTANQPKAKERIEAYAQEKTLVIDNWRSLKGYGVKGFSGMKTRQDKGHNAQFAALAHFAAHGGAPIIPFEQVINVTQASFAAIESLKGNCWIEIE